MPTTDALFPLSRLAAMGRLEVVPDPRLCVDAFGAPRVFRPNMGAERGANLDPATHLGAAALAYICARLLGASEEEACGASWRTFIDADGGYDGDDGPEGCTEVTLVTMADGRTFGAWILDGHIDNPEAILAVTRRCVQEAADASH